MPVIVCAADDRTTTTASGKTVGLAAPSQGSAELSSWRVTMNAGAEGPTHAIDREQVWMPLAGRFEFTADGETVAVAAGGAVVLPAGVVRRVRAAEGPAEAIVCMAVGGLATIPGNDERHRLPWAE